ncbi:PD-(D/E)XK nuclease family protein [Haliangium sp. UPWRP_2]|uniref:PD-(D/E)XK nuclease family protein n=1 Tax=Haliangium sp. UPWRP_2 TaxID=1931276 RepID=UPI000D0CF1FA|nr:PD-(D/E)XK nuclease family protein [Haliangium sp. UPWRP_2]PSM31942.1 hypothetical protein BVG81_002795 [Haliangium sp. UPWRP_2]
MAERVASWPSAPAHWSYTSLKVALECPRRWALREAGLQPAPTSMTLTRSSALVGRIRGGASHAMLQRMIGLHCQHNGPRAGTPEMISFWREHMPAGLLATTQDVVREELARAVAGTNIDGIALRELQHQCEAGLREIVNFVTASFRVALEILGKGSPQGTILNGAKTALEPGLRSEIPVSARLGSDRATYWFGRIDVVVITNSTIALIDFKTGHPSPEHRVQLELYALLFARDRKLNPCGRRVDNLILVYPNAEIIRWLAPGDTQLAELERAVASQATIASEQINASPPVARPEPSRCAPCDMRAHCDAYWVQLPHDLKFGEYRVDLRIEVESVRGDTEVVGRLVAPGRDRLVLLFRPRRPPSVRVGELLRVVGATPVSDQGEAEALLVFEVGAGSVISE